jgi:hypothetical protein
LSLRADGNVATQLGATKTLKAKKTTLQGKSINVDQLDTAFINFNSTGNVAIDSVSRLTVAGANTGQTVSIATPNRIGNAPGATIDAHRLELSGLSVWLANQTSTDRVTVAGLASFHALDGFVIVGDKGSVYASSLNIQTGYAKVRFDGNMHLAGSNIAASAQFYSTEHITDGLNTTIDIMGNAEFHTPGAVFLADQSINNVLRFCGHAFFDAERFVRVFENGNVTMNTWSATPGVGNSVSVDSRSC